MCVLLYCDQIYERPAISACSVNDKIHCRCQNNHVQLVYSVEFIHLQINLVIRYYRTNTNATISAMLIDDGGVFLAVLVDKGGCGVRGATGVFFWINSAQQMWFITSDIGKIL